MQFNKENLYLTYKILWQKGDVKPYPEDWHSVNVAIRLFFKEQVFSCDLNVPKILHAY